MPSTVQWLTTAFIVIPFCGWAGFTVHEVVHYRAAEIWNGGPRLEFASVVPSAVDLNSADNFPDWGIRFFGVAPTLVFVPILLILLYSVGLPPNPLAFNERLSVLQLLHIGVIEMLSIGGFPSPADIFVAMNPGEVRTMVADEDEFGNERALRRLFFD